ncbi:MAG: hypothetical protein ACT4PW_12675 [Acidimicrobiia bacterium]
MGELVLVGVLALGLLFMARTMIRGYRTASIPDLEAPTGVTLAPSSGTSTTTVDLSALDLVAVDGTTTSVPPLEAGTSRLVGLVTGGGLPVGGATVRFERILSNGELQPFDVLTDGEGRYDLANIPGGRYRARGFLAPRLSSARSEAFFLLAGEVREFPLLLDLSAGLSASAAVFPNPPVLGQPLSLTVRIVSRAIDADGSVRSTPVPGTNVSLSNTGNWQVTGANGAAAVAGGDGSASFQLLCRNPGPNSITVALSAPAGFSSVPLDPASTTTTTATTTTTTLPGRPAPPPVTLPRESSTQTLSVPDCMAPPPPSSVAPSSTTG